MNSVTKKKFGAFYTPIILADLLSKRMFNVARDMKLNNLYVMDPAIGEGSLIKSLIKVSANYKINLTIIGIDINKEAIDKSKKAIQDYGSNCNFINTDALYPFGKGHVEGWEYMKSKLFPEGINFVISNPPWGADLSGYKDLKDNFEVAKGQFDIYDLFIETIIDNLSDGGVYGIIVPDSIYNQEHYPIRKKLLEETTLYYIYRLGESFFNGVNTSISIIIGRKSKANKRHSVSCFHLNSEDRDSATNDFAFLDKLSKKKANKILQLQMIQSNYSFILDIQKEEFKLFELFDKADSHLCDFVKSIRGAEISKKGIIVKCPSCDKWFPSPNLKNKKKYKCPNCHRVVDFTQAKRTNIITDFSSNNNTGIIVGEDIYRYFTKVSKQIELGYPGINYKNPDIYKGSKILIRKTGVGITAGIDRTGSYTNQVVYIVKRKDTCPSYITNEFILAVLCSRAMTYFYIKKYGSTEWRSHPYITQKALDNLPFPPVNNKNISTINKITDKVKRIDNVNIDCRTDIEIESLIARVWGLDKSSYRIIFKELQSVQPLIPFKRLLSFSEKEMLWDIDI